MKFNKKIKLINNYFPEIDKLKIEKFYILYKIYNFYYKNINIFSKKSFNGFFEKHCIHTLSISKIIKFLKKSIVLDVGTGGGFPGIPLAIMFNETKFILIDSIKKKIKIIQIIIDELHLNNVQIVCTRIENFEKKCNFILGRAVTQLSNFIKLVKKNIKFNYKNKIFNGIFYLKGKPFEKEKKKQYLYIEYNIYNFIKTKFFFNKKIVYIPIVKTK
ncbi:16S rRNA (guanine(527)-N(7))-methyltransferase RsmG [Candidatus Karelsulcia muelleri]|uniref:16S rRNA (guanine(527)-N(7))-methyltransferase RsmG n=1 Tax=Candidatus Karelsulcia muelleri TaxID=336810 RepID=UPI000D7BDA37|nr:16S rRNA (guanine(527)-N(7))-methyltransferase RsmG [Candidatus Karelsulcia muelleri]